MPVGLKRGRKPGPVWMFFTMEDDKLHARCNACGTRRCKNVVTLENHLEVCDQLSDNDRDKWEGILEQRKQSGRSSKRRRLSSHRRYPDDSGASANRCMPSRNVSSSRLFFSLFSYLLCISAQSQTSQRKRQPKPSLNR